MGMGGLNNMDMDRLSHFYLANSMHRGGLNNMDMDGFNWILGHF